VLKITNKDKIICIILKDNDWEEGLRFITPESLFLQVGTWWYKKGKKLDAHKHKDYERIVNRTMESIYVKKGAIKINLFDEDNYFLESLTIYEGDTAVFAYGGHGYEILSENTKILEFKNGPFIDVSKDKEKF